MGGCESVTHKKKSSRITDLFSNWHVNQGSDGARLVKKRALP